MISTRELRRRVRVGGILASSTFSGVGLAALLAAAAPAVAQEVVQPLPPHAAQDLNNALRALSQDPRDVEALLAAGEASLELRDPDAALGFFRRAEAVDAANPDIRTGMAGAQLLLGDPVESLRLFAEAEAAGADLTDYLPERGLAYDLVGDNLRAQQQYLAVLNEGDLTRDADAMVRRQLALSQAIAGDIASSEATLLPLLQAEDRAAFRTRAFALAIAGRVEDATAISGALLPERMAVRLNPYLRQMPRLTRAQQAAAANLGQFPAAGQIGHDDARIASYAAASPPQALASAPRTSDQRLVPAGEPLGRSREQSAEPRVTGGRLTVERQQTARPRVTGGQLTVERRPLETTVAAESPATEELLAQPASAPPTAEEPVVVAREEAAPSPPPQEIPQPSLSIAGALPAGQPAEQPTEAPEVDLAEVFADFQLREAASSARTPDAVDITAIQPPRERAEPPPPAHPQRHWVQVATGRDVSALGFDWRRIRRNSSGLLDDREPFTARWGETNRLVTGPYDSADAAQEMVTRLKEAGVDSFRFTSATGEEVTPLD